MELKEIFSDKKVLIDYPTSNIRHQYVPRQQNTLYPKGGGFCEINFLKPVIGSQPNFL